MHGLSLAIRLTLPQEQLRHNKLQKQQPLLWVQKSQVTAGIDLKSPKLLTHNSKQKKRICSERFLFEMHYLQAELNIKKEQLLAILLPSQRRHATAVILISMIVLPQ